MMCLVDQLFQTTLLHEKKPFEFFDIYLQTIMQKF